MPTTTCLAQLRFAASAHRDGDAPAAHYHLLLAAIDTIDDLGNMLAKINATIARFNAQIANHQLIFPTATPIPDNPCEQDSIQ